ncbi:Chaperone protein dnaJ 49 [Acorus calamus]|uniref:Chaperone protein dnaJ 49 n=1 Tax=Acorus calamus TaxID=4465 RepID=A0AAV9DXE5_ACOCL|nr:Chaperone protein dnaJ 49 [Acorus calamus]
MQAFLLGPSGPTGGGGRGERGLFRRHLKPPIFLGRWRPPPANHTPVPVAAASMTSDGHGEDHYAVLGLPRRASSADVKKAYRLLALKYHPDVSKDMQAGEVFKSIRQAYEVLSNEATRAQYDWELQTQEETYRPRHRNRTSGDQSEKKRRKRRWAEVRHRMWYEEHYDENPYYSQTSTYRETTQDIQRGSFLEVLRFSFFVLVLSQTIGSFLSLTLCGAFALLDKDLDAGYKMGYVIAWCLRGQGGILLMLFISFASWLCGKNNSSLVALVVLAMWVGANLARFAPLPPGAVLALLYMSIKLQEDSR